MSARNTCFMTRKTTRARKRARKFIDLHPFRTQPLAGPFCAPRRRIYLPTVEMTPNLLYTRCTYRRYRKKTCSGLHGRAQVGGVGKQRVLSRTGTFPGKLPHQFDSDPRVSLFARALPGSGTRANRKNVCSQEDRFQTISALNFLDRVLGRNPRKRKSCCVILLEYREM